MKRQPTSNQSVNLQQTKRQPPAHSSQPPHQELNHMGKAKQTLKLNPLSHLHTALNHLRKLMLLLKHLHLKSKPSQPEAHNSHKPQEMNSNAKAITP